MGASTGAERKRCMNVPSICSSAVVERQSGFESFTQPPHEQPRATSRSRSRARARDNNTLTLLRPTRRDSAMSSCALPSTYASHRSARSRGLSSEKTRATSISRRVGDHGGALPGTWGSAHHACAFATGRQSGCLRSEIHSGAIPRRLTVRCPPGEVAEMRLGRCRRRRQRRSSHGRRSVGPSGHAADRTRQRRVP